MTLNFKNSEILVLDPTQDVEKKKNGFTKVPDQYIAEIVNCGAECKKYTIGNTILFKYKQGVPVFPFEFEGIKYLMMTEAQVICQVI